jgi:hypothetical protein
MMNDRSAQTDHRDIAELAPWYLNGTLGERERQRVDEHLAGCAACREVFLIERRIYESMAAVPGVEYMPMASLKRLQSSLDALHGAVAPSQPAEPPARRAPAWSRVLPWKGLAAASIALFAVTLAFLSADRWVRFRPPGLSSNYHTVTNSDSRAPDEVIRAVFSPSITLVDLQAILDEAQLRIVSGPTEAGVYSLAATSRRPVGASLESLRSHAQVRFAESTQAASTQAASTRESP